MNKMLWKTQHGCTSRASSLQAAQNLRWSAKGEGIFDNPNPDGWTYRANAYVYCPDGSCKKFSGPLISQSGTVTLDLYHYFDQSGSYSFEIELLTNDSSVRSECSETFEYQKPDIRLPKPMVSVNEAGIVSCTLAEGGEGYVLGTDYGFNYELWAGGKRVFQQGLNESSINFSGSMSLDYVVYVRVCTISRDVTKYADSEWSDMIPLNPGAASQEPAKTAWEFNPADWGLAADVLEQYIAYLEKQYAAQSTEVPAFTTDPQNAYDVTVENSEQGYLCYLAFKTVLGDYTIGRTYNICPSGMADSKARITLTIPQELQKAGRTFRMICVNEDGQPIVLADLDSASDTVTFETDAYCAFALVYKDSASAR